MRERREMVEQQLRRRGIRDARVLRAMSELPRELFVPDDQWPNAYADTPVSIGYEQTISQPYMTALMCESLALGGDETVLDIGAGSGYHAAVLSMLARRVYSIEIVGELAEQARRNIEAAGLARNIDVIWGDGSKGYAEGMPYDAISVAAAAPEIPAALLEQLRDPGRLVIPIGSTRDQDLTVITKLRGMIESYVPTMCQFVPLRGEKGFRD